MGCTESTPKSENYLVVQSKIEIQAEYSESQFAGAVASSVPIRRSASPLGRIRSAHFQALLEKEFLNLCRRRNALVAICKKRNKMKVRNGRHNEQSRESDAIYIFANILSFPRIGEMSSLSQLRKAVEWFSHRLNRLVFVCRGRKVLMFNGAELFGVVYRPVRSVSPTSSFSPFQVSGYLEEEEEEEEANTPGIDSTFTQAFSDTEASTIFGGHSGSRNTFSPTTKFSSENYGCYEIGGNGRATTVSPDFEFEVENYGYSPRG